MDSAVSAYLGELRFELESAAPAARSRLVQGAADFLGCSRQTVYRQLRELGWQSGRNRRRDAGQRRVEREHAQAVAELMASSRSAKGLIRMPVTEAVSIAQANGKIPEGLSVDAVRRALYDYRVHPELTSRRTHTSTRSLHPNHVWQLDPSLCVLYYLDGGGLAAMSERVFYKNKPENCARIAKDRVLRYVITDHATGAFYVRYYLTPGERVEVLFDFLMRAFNERDGQPFHGVPFHLIWDKGSANTSHAIQHVLDALDVGHWSHKVGNSRAKGQVESAQWLIETHLEARLAMHRVQCIDELNALGDSWQAFFNGHKTHGRTGQTRYGLWQTIRPEQLRTPPPREVCQDLLVAKPQERQVKGDLTVQFTVKGHEPAFYDVQHIQDLVPGQKIQVTVNPYRAPNIFVLTEDEHGQRINIECEPIGRDAYGFRVDAPILGQGFQAKRETALDAESKRQDEAIWGSSDPAEIDKAKANRVPAFAGTVDAFADVNQTTPPSWMKRPGTELHVPPSVRLEERPLTHVEALRALKRRLDRALTPAENAAVRDEFADGVPEEALDKLVERFSTPQPARPALTVIGGSR